MLSRNIRQQRQGGGLIRGTGALMLLVGLSVLGCAGNSSQPAPVPTQEIRKESDRFFDKMKQEERERGPDAQQAIP